MPQHDRTDATRRAERLIDVMLAAQSRFAAEWKAGVPLTPQQQRDEATRDQARDDLMRMLANV